MPKSPDLPTQATVCMAFWWRHCVDGERQLMKEREVANPRLTSWGDDRLNAELLRLVLTPGRDVVQIRLVQPAPVLAGVAVKLTVNRAYYGKRSRSTMPTVTINMTGLGTTYTDPDNGKRGPSLAGHMWYELTVDQGRTTSHGFAPRKDWAGWPLAPGDVFLLCTDRLWEYVDEAVLQQTLQQARDPREWLSTLEARVLRNAAHQPQPRQLQRPHGVGAGRSCLSMTNQMEA